MGKTLPLTAGAKVYTTGTGKADVKKYGCAVTERNYDAAKGQIRPSAAGADFAVIRVLVKDADSAYSSKDPATDANPLQLNPPTGKTWGAQDPCGMFPLVNATCSDTGLFFGGGLPWEANDLIFTGMATAKSGVMTPSLADIKATMAEVGDPRKVVLAIYFRAPYILNDASGLKDAGAIVAGFGVSDSALLEVLGGKFKPQGKRPFALPKTQLAVKQQSSSDVPGYKEPRMAPCIPSGFA